MKKSIPGGNVRTSWSKMPPSGTKVSNTINSRMPVTMPGTSASLRPHWMGLQQRNETPLHFGSSNILKGAKSPHSPQIRTNMIKTGANLIKPAQLMTPNNQFPNFRPFRQQNVARHVNVNSIPLNMPINLNCDMRFFPNIPKTANSLDSATSVFSRFPKQKFVKNKASFTKRKPNCPKCVKVGFVRWWCIHCRGSGVCEHLRIRRQCSDCTRLQHQQRKHLYSGPAETSSPRFIINGLNAAQPFPHTTTAPASITKAEHPPNMSFLQQPYTRNFISPCGQTFSAIQKDGVRLPQPLYPHTLQEKNGDGMPVHTLRQPHERPPVPENLANLPVPELTTIYIPPKPKRKPKRKRKPQPQRKRKRKRKQQSTVKKETSRTLWISTNRLSVHHSRPLELGEVIQSRLHGQLHTAIVNEKAPDGCAMLLYYPGLEERQWITPGPRFRRGVEWFLKADRIWGVASNHPPHVLTSDTNKIVQTRLVLPQRQQKTRLTL